MAGSIINTKITHAVTLGGVGYLSPLTITSAGEVAPSTAGVTALFATVAAGYVLNQGKISSGGGGAGSAGGTGTVGGAGGAGGIGVTLTAGTLINAGTIASGAGGTGGAGGYFAAGGQGGTGGTGVDLVAGSLTNASGATIAGGNGGTGGASGRNFDVTGLQGGNGGYGGVGVRVVTGSVTNNGTIAGGFFGAGGNGGFGQSSFGAQGLPGFFGGIGVTFQSGGTLTNAGLIRGGIGLFGTAAAVDFGGGASRLILNAGASFSGAVVANAAFSNVIELASSASTGTISGIGSEYVGFSRIVVDSGARWTVIGANTIPVGVTLTVSGAGSLTNAGTIAGGTGSGGAAGASFGAAGGAGGTGGTAVNVSSATLISTGKIAGGTGGTGGAGAGGSGFGGFGGTGGIGAILTAGGLTNPLGATLAGGKGGAGGAGGYSIGGLGGSGGSGGNGGIGVTVVSGSLTNAGTITGGNYGLGGAGGNGNPVGHPGIPGIGGVGVRFQSGGTLTNSGLIRGGVGLGGYADAIDFVGGASRLILNPGASFQGAVVANAAFSNVVELTSAVSVGTIGGFGSRYTGFSQVVVDSGARWTLNGANAFAASGALTVTGAGSLTNSGSIAGGIGGSAGGYGDTGGIGVNAAAGSLTNASGASITGGAGGQGYTGRGGTGGIGAYLTAGSLTNALGAVIAGGAGGTAPIVINSYGTFGGDISGNGGIGIEFAAGSLTNAGLIKGGYGIRGGIGVDATGGTLINNKTIAGGAGEVGGTGLHATNGSFTNGSGATITGGAATVDAFGPFGVGATGVALAGGSLTNNGMIAGSAAGAGGGGGLGNGRVGGAGGIGVDLTAGTVTNNSTIASGTGGAGGAGGFGTGGAGGAGGVGVIVAGGALTNSGKIAAAAGGNGGSAISVGGAGGNGGMGVNLTSGSLINNGVIAGGAAGSGGGGASGGAGGVGGAGVFLSGGSVTNFGTITGGAGGLGSTNDAGGGYGVRFQQGGTLTNAGSIAGGYGHLHTLALVRSGAVYFGAGASRLIVDPGASFAGAVVANAAFSNVLELASGASAGTIYGLGAQSANLGMITQFNNFGTVTIDANAVWTLTGGATIAAGATLTELSGAKVTVSGALVNNGNIVIDPSTMVVGNLSGTGSVTIAAGSTLEVQGSIAATETIGFAGTNAYLRLDSPGNVLASVVNFGVSDTIDLKGVDPASISLAGGTLTFGGGSFRLAIAAGDALHAAASADGAVLTASLACFAEGTGIATPRGRVAVETLRAGDLVSTHRGSPRKVRWIGHRHIDLARHPTPLDVSPIRIRRDALAPNVPARDLRVSPDHAIWFEAGLVPARLLLNGASIVRDESSRSVTWYHVELDTHDVLLAEDAPAESYLDTGNRGMFENANEPLVLHPVFADGQAGRVGRSCAPFLDDPSVIEPIWRRLFNRAADLGFERPAEAITSGDPRLMVQAGGRLYQPLTVRDGVYTFALVISDEPVRLMSRAVQPSSEKPWVSDRRMLGVALRGMRLYRGARVEVMPADHPALTDGWWAVEHDDGVPRRWTTGNAVLPLTSRGPVILEMDIGTVSRRYPALEPGRVAA